MIDFKLTEEQLLLKETARKFVEKEVMPVVSEYDKTGEFPTELVNKAFDAGLMNLCLPTEYGGVGLSLVDACIVGEELAAGCSGFSTTLMVNDLATIPLVMFGTEEQKKKFLIPFTEKRGLASFCLTEPGAGSDAASMSSTAVLDGEEYVINGRKCFITNGGYANLYTVFAYTDKTRKGRGVSAFIVPRDTKGLSVGKKENKMGQRASNTTDVILEDVRVPKENLLGKEGEGFKIAMMTLDKARCMVAAASVGVARAALEYAVKYAKQRVQFGAPIASNAMVQGILADMAKDIEAARMLTWYSAWMADNGLKQSKQSAMAKCFASDVAMKVTTDAVQIFGGYGYSKEYPVEKLMRDAKLMQIYEGTNQIQRMVIARELIAEM